MLLPLGSGDAVALHVFDARGAGHLGQQPLRLGEAAALLLLRRDQLEILGVQPPHAARVERVEVLHHGDRVAPLDAA